MSKVSVYNQQHEVVGELELDDAVFGAKVDEHLFYQVVRYQLAARRAGTHSTKGRAEVSGGGRKPWKQKGTGRARQGSTRSPHWRGGGVVHGPHPRKYDFKLNKKVRAAALRSALSRRLGENALFVVDRLEVAAPKTKQVTEFMKQFGVDEVLVLTNGLESEAAFALSARNLQAVTVQKAEGLNVYDVLNHRALVATVDAIASVTDRLRRA